MSTPNAPATGDDACTFNRQQKESGSTAWRGKCLALARTARRLPAVYPSALSAALATPKSERIPHIGDLRRGMVAYFDDPNDGNPYGHIVTVAGWDGPRDTLANLRVWSNDVVAGKPGAVGLVPGSFFPTHWGDGFQFGATWLNGYNFADLDAARIPPPPANALGKDFDAAIAALEKSIRQHRANGHKRIVAALAVDLAELRQTRALFT